MSDNLFPIPLWGLYGGLVLDRPSPEIPDKATDQCSNIFFTNDGRIAPRPGLVNFGSQFNTPLGGSASLFSDFVKTDGTEIRMSAELNTGTGAVHVYKFSGGAWVDLTGLLSPTGSEEIYQTAALFNGKWFIAPGTSDLLRFDGTNLVTVTSLQATPGLKPPTSPKIVLSAPSGSHLFLMNSTDVSGTVAPSTVYWSGQTDETCWNGGNAGKGSGAQALFDDDQPITAATFFGPFAIVLKARAMYVGQFQGFPKFWTFLRREEDHGCVAQGSIGVFSNMRIWLGDDNVYLFDGNQAKPIANTILQRLLQQINPSLMNRAFSVVDRYHTAYHLFLPLTGTSQLGKVFTFDLMRGVWSESAIDSSVLPVSGYALRTGNWQEELIVGTRAGVFADLSLAATTDIGATYTPTWRGKLLDAVAMMRAFGLLTNELMTVQKVAIHGTSGRLLVSLDYGDAIHELQTTPQQAIKLTQGEEIYLPFKVNARFVRVNLQWDMTSPCEVQGITMYIGRRDGVARK